MGFSEICCSYASIVFVRLSCDSVFNSSLTVFFKSYFVDEINDWRVQIP